MGFFSRLFGKKKRKRAPVYVVAARPRKSKVVRAKKPVKQKRGSGRQFLYYDKDDPTVPGYGYHYYLVSAPNATEARRIVSSRVGSDIDDRLRTVPASRVADEIGLVQGDPNHVLTRL
jgi:hypothetical protein